jgi:hypothetical protein
MDRSRLDLGGSQIASRELGLGWPVAMPAVLAGICADVIVAGVVGVAEWG